MTASLALRRLAEPLHETERMLWAWADWSRQFAGNVGWPGTSVAWRLARVHETGQSFSSRVPDVEMPPDVEAVETAILKLPTELQWIPHAHYFSHDPTEAKAKRAGVGLGAYSRALDNCRWALKSLMGV